MICRLISFFLLFFVSSLDGKGTNINKKRKKHNTRNTEEDGIANREKTLIGNTIALNGLVCSDCDSGGMQLNEVRDDWRKKKSYYEWLEKGPGTKTCMGMIAGIRCNKMIHTEIGKCGVAYVCRNGMCYKEEDVECDNWMCFDCNLVIAGGGRKRSRRGG
jgi:hypothetical protein